MKKIFEFEQIRDPRRVRFASSKLRSHASLWWDTLQLNRGDREKVKTWDRMVSEMKCNFFPMDYALNLLRRLDNLKQFDMLVKEYT